MTDNVWTVHESPVGPLMLLAGPTGLTSLRFPGDGAVLDETEHRPEAFSRALEQLDRYFAGDPRGFDLELDLGGTAFQRRVWRQLQQVPFGDTLSYTALARAVGYTDGAHTRAVAAAVGRTPVPLIVPCHRVVAADGALTGYRGGLHRKRALLDLEARAIAGVQWTPARLFRESELI